jgi:GNAT superfamily N-acetyltransferase
MTADWTVREVGQDDEDGLRAFWQAEVDARAVDTPDLPMEPFDAYLVTNGESPTRQLRWFLAERDGRTVGGAHTYLPTADNTSLARIEVTVAPDARRQGAGRAAFAVACDYAKAAGRTHAHLFTSEPFDGSGSPGAAFAEAAGAKRALEEIFRKVDLGTVSDEDLEQVRREAAAAAEGYDLVQWVGPVSDEDVDDLARLTALVSSDAPQGDLDFEPEVWDAARVRENEQRSLESNRIWVTTAARDRSTGSLVGYTDIGHTRHQPETGYQWMTVVENAHRGHRLGMLMKAANLVLLRASLPTVRQVFTWNAASNDHMVSINDAIGFRPRLRFTQWQLDL